MIEEKQDKRKLWRFATRYGFTRTITPSTVIADRVIQGQVIRTSVIPALRIEFNKTTKTYQTTDAEEAALILADKACRGTNNPKALFWLVEGYPKTIGPQKANEPISGPEPKVSDGPTIAVGGTRGTGSRIQKRTR